MISVHDVTKRYGSLTAVRGLSCEVRRSEIVGFLGPNGAGKSTLLKMMATFLLPTQGRITVDGIDVVADPLAVRARIGYLSGDNPLYFGMRADRFLEFVGRARGLAGARLSRQLAWVSEVCGIGDVLGQRIHECSTGFRQRIGLAGSLVHDPGVLLLDEPTHGLDPLQVLAFRDLLRVLREGRAILFSTHVVQDVAAVSDRVLIINDGDLLADATREELAAGGELTGALLERRFADLVLAHEAGGGGGTSARSAETARPQELVGG